MSSQRHFYLDGTGDYLTTPDAAGFSALGDFSVVALVALDDWTPAAQCGIATQWLTTGNQRSWTFEVTTAGKLNSAFSTDGAFGTVTTATSSAAVSASDGTAIWVLVTRTSSSGTVKFYTATATDGSSTIPAIGSFTQLGTNVTAGTGTLKDSTAKLVVGANDAGAGPLTGKVWRVAVYTGIYGGGSETKVADMLADDYSSGTTFTSSATSETWTRVGDSRCDVRNFPGVSATATGTANNAAASVKPSAGVGSATGTANNATASVAPSPSAASGTGTANTAAASVKPNAGAATGSGAANAAAGSVAPAPGTATGTGTANNAAPVSGTFASAGSASGAGTANDATTSVAASTGSAAGSGSAGAGAGSVAPSPGSAAGTGSAYDATTSGATTETTTEQPRFGGSPISKRDLDRMVWEQQLERLLREDEEILCLV